MKGYCMEEIINYIRKNPNGISYDDIIDKFYTYTDNDIKKILLTYLKQKTIRKENYYVCPNCNEKYLQSEMNESGFKKCEICGYEFDLEENLHIFFYSNQKELII